MKTLKRPLSVLIAALMLVSVMLVAPVSASAEGTPTVTEYKWVKAELEEGQTTYYSIPINALYDRFQILRVKPGEYTEQELQAKLNDFDRTVIWGKSADDYYLSSNVGSGTGNEYKQNSYWNDNSGKIYTTVHDDSSRPTKLCINDFVSGSTATDWYVRTWRDVVPNYNAANSLTSGSKHNIPCYTLGTEGSYRYFLLENASYVEKSVSQIFFDYITADGEGVNMGEDITPDGGDSIAADYGAANFKNNTILGHQVAAADNRGTIRFVSLLKTSMLRDADEYGYIVTKTKQDESLAMTDADRLTLEDVRPEKAVKLECNDTDNAICGDYGVVDTNTDYKYITMAVNDLNDPSIEPGWKVLARFYVIKGDEVYYAKCGDYDGLAVPFSAVFS